MELLQVKGLKVGYGRIEILKGISLSVVQEGMVTLIGANGAGKSTTLRTITGLLKPFAGVVIFQGTRIDPLSPHQIVSLGISMVPENRRIFSGLTVLDNLKTGAIPSWDKRKMEKDIESVFKLFPILRDRRWQMGKTLSGGEQQMLAIGRALMSKPKLLLLDEPSMGLAPVLVKFVFEIIAGIIQEGTSILLIEQNAKMALSVSDFGYVLETGRIILSGRSGDLLQNDTIRKAYLGEE